MEYVETDNLKKIHNRNLDISSYIIDEEHILITREFQERNLITVYEKPDKPIEPHIFHHMKIQLLIKNAVLKIQAKNLFWLLKNIWLTAVGRGVRMVR